jgi:hypothetical protein
MTVPSERRYYLTLPDPEYKRALIRRAYQADMTVSEYVINRLLVLDRVEDMGIGAPLVKAVEQSILGDSGSAQ